MIVAGVLDGTPLSEVGTLAQIASGANWIIQRSNHLKISVVNLSLDVIHPGTAFQQLVSVLSALSFVNIQPVVAVGNRGHGHRSLIANHALSVGAHDANGVSWRHNCDQPDLLAPGVDMECPQPPIAYLSFRSYDHYSGTSLSTPMVSGCLAVLQEATGRSIRDCVNALRVSASGSSSHGKQGIGGGNRMNAFAAFQLLVNHPGPIVP